MYLFLTALFCLTGRKGRKDKVHSRFTANDAKNTGASILKHPYDVCEQVRGSVVFAHAHFRRTQIYFAPVSPGFASASFFRARRIFLISSV
jgi:hypothetical protein